MTDLATDTAAIATDDIVIVTLKKPVTHGDKTYSQLTFREATVGDFMVGDLVKGEMSQNVAILASISDTPLPVFKKIKGVDFNRILDVTRPLLGNGVLTTGE